MNKLTDGFTASAEKERSEEHGYRLLEIARSKNLGKAEAKPLLETADLTLRDADGMTALMSAAHMKNLDLTTAILTAMETRLSPSELRETLLAKNTSESSDMKGYTARALVSENGTEHAHKSPWFGLRDRIKEHTEASPRLATASNPQIEM